MVERNTKSTKQKYKYMYVDSTRQKIVLHCTEQKIKAKYKLNKHIQGKNVVTDLTQASTDREMKFPSAKKQYDERKPRI